MVPMSNAPKAIHMMIRVSQEARSLAFYKSLLGLDISERVDFDTFTLIYLKNASSPFEIELTVNKDRTEPYTLGDAYGHVAFVVDDLASARAQAVAAGLSPGDIKHMSHNGKPFGSFFFISDPDGYKIEVLQKGGRFQ